MTERSSPDSAIAALAERFWRVHPKEIQDLGITRQQFYEQEIRALFATINGEAARALRPEALQALKGYIQADADGVMVYVSRQALDEAVAALDVAQPAPSPDIFEIHQALKVANIEYAAFSCNGFNLVGDAKSIKAAAEAFHSHAQIDQFRTQIRHWREECGKLHAKLSSTIPSIDRACTCHPAIKCQHKYSFHECLISYLKSGDK